jgi:hypothetical protein
MASIKASAPEVCQGLSAGLLPTSREASQHSPPTRQAIGSPARAGPPDSLARIYGITDADGSRPDCWSYVPEIEDTGPTAREAGSERHREHHAVAVSVNRRPTRPPPTTGPSG